MPGIRCLNWGRDRKICRSSVRFIYLYTCSWFWNIYVLSSPEHFKFLISGIFWGDLRRDKEWNIYAPKTLSVLVHLVFSHWRAVKYFQLSFFSSFYYHFLISLWMFELLLKHVPIFKKVIYTVHNSSPADFIGYKDFSTFVLRSLFPALVCRKLWLW